MSVTLDRRDEYIDHWKDSRSCGSFRLTPDSFFIRMDDMDTYEILRFREPMEAVVYLRYRGFPEMLEESSDSLLFGIQTFRERILDRGCHCRSTGLELLERLDRAIERDSVDLEEMEKMITLFTSTSVFAFQHSCYMRYWIRAHVHVVEFLSDDVFREDFEQAGKMELIDFIELELLLRNGGFDATESRHMSIASGFMDWAGDVFRQTERMEG